MCVKLVLVAALLVLASGCGGSDQAAVRVPSSPYPGAEANCPTAEPSPISVSMARAALREHGFTVAEADGWCGLDLISAMLTNASSSFVAGTVMRREGLLQCYVLVAPRRLDATPTVEGDTLAASAERRVANLDCDLWGAEKNGFERHVLRLERAFRDLLRRVEP
jgi:hypothetical protein